MVTRVPRYPALCTLLSVQGWCPGAHTGELRTEPGQTPVVFWVVNVMRTSRRVCDVITHVSVNVMRTSRRVCDVITYVSV